MGALRDYEARRDFAATPEPRGTKRAGGPALRYGIQMHDATRLHWDLRLEWQGVLLSWAVTRGPSSDPADKRLAVRTEDHPFDYLTFEGSIPAGQYGAGTVMLWDIGWWQPLHDVGEGLEKGHLHFMLHGRRATGGWSLVRMKGRQRRENWLMVKDRDAAATGPSPTPLAEAHATSVSSGRSLAQIAEGAKARPFGPARKGPTPRFRKVQLATLVSAPPEGEGWLHEVKHDGYRAQVAIGRGGVRIRTRNAHDWSERFAELLPAFAELACDSALIDGEIVAGAGLEGFSALQEAIRAGGPFLCQAFDLLERDGESLADRPLTERRAALARLLEAAPARGPLRLSPAVEGAAAEALETVCAAGGEGLVSKRADAPYLAGRGPGWQKAKCIRRAEFLICGWQPSDKRGRPFASLLLATMERGALTWRGRVGTGFDAAEMERLAAALKPLARRSSPLRDTPSEARGARWVEPRLVAEIAHAEVTRDGRLRHARYVALREDKRPAQVRLDPPTELLMEKKAGHARAGEPDAAHTGDRPRVAGIGISHPGRLIFPKPKRTKLALAHWYAEMADRILPALADRPVSLLRLPEGLEGERFVQKHAGKGFPDAIRNIPLEEADGETAQYMRLTDAAGLVAAVQMGTVEFHPWGARADRPDRPERLVFDLDPDEGLGFAAVRRAALELRDRLGDLGLGCWPLLTGGKGVHLVVPLRRTASWESAKLFAQAFATLAADAAPERYTASLSKRARRGRIFIDWLRNERGATAVAPFSVRARPGAPVAVPLGWDELGRIRRADAFSMPRAAERGWSDAALPAPATLNAGLIRRLEASAA
ncbi:DNA ligase D [Oceanicella sp. SM1341]|uniref:DNA ligase D n=1 Tax=Oceanicella sp. SM1341 TaxID=1548889 RepID=UPI000E4C1A54|nr:DNA ligase D [Oceanicella sp. SM1341]